MSPAIPYYREEGWAPSNLPYFQLMIAFIWAIYLFETYLDIRQHRRLCDKELPSALLNALKSLDEEKEKELKAENNGRDSDATHGASFVNEVKAKFEKAQRYGRDKSSFAFIQNGFNQIESTASLLLGFMPFLWVQSRTLVGFVGLSPENEIWRACALLIMNTVFSLVVHLPFELYGTFVIEERHGFNKQTLGLFFMDKLKSLLMSAVLGLPVVSILLYIIQWGGERFYIYVWAFMFVFSIFMMTIYPTFIAPLFNKFTPLEEGSLRAKIEKLAASLNFPLTKLFVVDGSRRSNHSNAYFYGFFKNKRIVLFDTLLEQLEEDEIIGVLAHELGHWKYWHTIQSFVVSQAYVFIAFFFFGQCQYDRELFASFGFSKNATPTIIGLLLFFEAIWAPIDKALNFLLTLNSRAKEFEADAFAKQLGYSSELQSGLGKLHLANLSNMNPDPLFSAYHYSHPPLVERLKALQQADSKTSAGKKRD